ncbi:hypothetical protein DEO72_LG4g996 [Vigna unguiculata]|uniref:Uncharacterized protein n=1 Tax=Vigna unguiculata TaxID=3917 RepID=A0A4D6LPV1_VIGUN|nr:hypothetical protein DEO72_LG4g996 [Vigna unguiculata]
MKWVLHFSPQRDLKSLNPHKDPRLDEDSTKNTPSLIATSLRRAFSPKRAYLSLRTPKPLAWARCPTQNSQVSSRPRLGECLSPERETKSLNPFPGRLGETHEPEPKMRLCNSRLGEMDPLGQDLPIFESVHAHNSPKLNQNPT